MQNYSFLFSLYNKFLKLPTFMYEKRDYLMIQIEQLGRVLGKILSDLFGLKSSGRVSESYQLVKESLISELDIDFDILIDMSESQFSSDLSTKLMKSSLLYSQFAELLIETSSIQFDSIKKLKLLEKTMILYRMEIEINKTFSISHQNKLDSLQQLINDLRNKL